MLTALLDGDIFIYRVGHTTNDESIDVAKYRIDEMISNVLLATGSTAMEVYITDSEGNFRNELYPEYKKNRVQPKPRHLHALREHLIDEWGADLAVGQEADDSLGIEQVRLIGTTLDVSSSVICSIDKDLKQIPGMHYNFVQEKYFTIDLDQALKNFYKQLLIGDVSDNVPGVKGIGVKKADKFIDPCKDEEEMLHVVRQLYNDDDRLLLTGKLLKIRQYKGEVWTFPNFLKSQPSAAVKPESTPPWEEDRIPFMDHIGVEPSGC